MKPPVRAETGASSTIQVCNRVDPGCESPLAADVTIVPTEREVSVEIPGGQNVFLLLTATGTVDTVLYFDGPLYEDQTGGRIQMLTLPTVLGLATQLQVPLDPTLGVIGIRAHDCNGTIVAGARYTINDTSGTTFSYTFVNGLPRTDFPPTPGVSTTITSDNSPWAGFVNVPGGALTIYGVLAEGMREFGTADIQVRPGHMNLVEIRPLNRL